MADKFNFGRLDQTFEADWPVAVPVPQDGGTIKTEEFMARFRLLAERDLPSVIKSDTDGREVFRRFFVGFGKDTDRELTEELFNQLVDTTYVRDAISRAYRNFAQGIAAKN